MLTDTAANGGSRHEISNLSTKFDGNFPVKKSITPPSGYSGHNYEQINHVNMAI